MNQQFDKIKNYEQKLQFTINKLEPQHRLPTENSINNASYMGGILKQSQNNNQNYIQFLESITPQSNKSNQFNRSFLVERQNTDQEQTRDNILPQINNPRSKSENKNGAQNNSSQQYLDQQKQTFYNNRQSSSKNQKRSHNYNFYAQPKNAVEVIITQNEFESTNSSNLWNELQMRKPNYRYPNTTKYSQSNKITLQQSNGRQLQSRDLIRSLTIDNNNCNSSNSKSRNYLDDLQIYNNAVNRLDTSSSQNFSQPLSKHMINIKNIVKNQSLTPISQSFNNNRFQELQINTNDNNGNYSNLRLSNQCFSTPHKGYYKDMNSKMFLNKSYDYDLKIKPPLLHKTKTNEKNIQTELKEIEEQNDQLSENIIKNENIQISLNRNHLKNISSSSNRYNKHNYNLSSPQMMLQQHSKQQQANIQQQYYERIVTDSEIQSNRSNQNNLSFHHTSFSKNQYLIDERKVVNIQVQNAEMDQYIRQIQKYVFKKQHDIDNNSSLSFKRPNVIHPSDLAEHVFNNQMKINSSNQQLLNNLQQTDSNQDLRQTLIENDIHLEQPLIMQQHTFQQQNQDIKQLQVVDQNLYQMNPKQDIDFNQQDKNSLEQTETKNQNNLQLQKNYQDMKNKDQIQNIDQQNKNDEKLNNNQMNETLSRQYSFSACYNQNKSILPLSRNSEQVDQTPKLNSQEQLQIPSQKSSLDENSSQQNQQINQEDIDFFDKKRSAEFGINYNSNKGSKKQIKNSSHQQINSKNTQLELLQENTQQQINQSPKNNQNNNSSKGLLKNHQYLTQTAQLSSQKSSNQTSYNSPQSYKIVNQQSSQSSYYQSSQISNQPNSQNSPNEQSYKSSKELSQRNSEQYSPQDLSSQSQQDSNRLLSQGSNQFPSQNSNNFSPYNCSKTKLLENNQRLDSQRVQQQQQHQESSHQSQNAFMKFNPDKRNQIIIAQEGNSKQISKRNSNSSSKSKQIQIETNSARNNQEELLQQKSNDKINLPIQMNQNQIQNGSIQINLDHNQISLQGASALESHQTASQQTSKKNSVSQQFYQGIFMNTLRKDPSFQNSDSNPNQYNQEETPYSSNQNTNRDQINEELHQQNIENAQFIQKRENNIDKIEQMSQINNQKQDMLLNQSQNGFQNHQFYEKERRKLKAQIQQQQKYKKQDKKSEAEEKTNQTETSNKYPNDSRYIQKQIFHKESLETQNARGQNRHIEFLTTEAAHEDEQSQRKKRFNTVENEGRYLRTDSQDSSQWLRENIIVKNESPNINQANSTQKSFKSKSKDSTLQSFYQSNMFNIINIGGSVEDPIKIVKKCNQFKKQGYIKLSYKETQFVNSQKKSNQLTPKKKSINKVSISPTRNQDSNVTSIKTSPQSKIQSKTKLINSSEISFQSPNKFHVSKQL